MNNTLELLIFILPFAFSIHNLEETLGMEKWTKSIQPFIHAPVTTQQFAIAAGLFTALGFAIIFSRNFYPSETMYLLVVTSFAGMLFLNIFFPHLIATFYLKKYAPGVVSGLLINLPLTTLIFIMVVRLKKLTLIQVCAATLIGGLVGIAIAFSFLKIGKMIDEANKPTSNA